MHKLIAKTAGVAGLAIIGAALFTAPASAAPASIDATFNMTNSAPTAGYGDRYVHAGQVVTTQLNATSADEIAAGSVNLTWKTSGGATIASDSIRQSLTSGTTTLTGIIESDTKLQLNAWAAALGGTDNYGHLYATVQIPEDAKPGDVFPVETDIGTYGTGNTNTATETVQTVDLTVADDAPLAFTTAAGDVVDNDMFVTGTGAQGATVVLTDETGATVATVMVGADGKWSMPASVLADGSHTLTATQTDLSGQQTSGVITIAKVGDVLETPVVDPRIAGGFAGLLALFGAAFFLRRLVGRS